jgi:hypothetical protein
MEWIFVIVLGLLLFAIPELLRSKNKRKYEYPEIPDPEQQMYRRPLSYEGEGVGREALKETTEGKRMEWENPGQVVGPVLVGVSPHVEEGNPWNGQLCLPRVVNGVIFAEILQPPRAKRPVPHWWRK